LIFAEVGDLGVILVNTLSLYKLNEVIFLTRRIAHLGSSPMTYSI